MLVCFLATPADAWRTVLGQQADSAASDILVEASGDAYVSGTLFQAFDNAFAVVKLAGDDGAEIWRTTVEEVGRANASAFDGAGDVIAVGYVFRLIYNRDRIAVKLRASDGLELWRRETFAEGIDEFLAVAVDAAGDVFAVGFDNSGGERLLIEKIRGTDGVVLFSQTFPGVAANRANSVVVDGTGSPIIGGVRSVVDEDFSVLKLPAGGGAPLWEVGIDGAHPFTGEEAAHALALAGGDVVAVGYISQDSLDDDILAVKLQGSDGAELWRRQITGSRSIDLDAAHAVNIDGAGNVVVAGQMGGFFLSDMAVVKLDGSDGTEIWRQEIDGAQSAGDVARDVVVDSNGDVIAVGHLWMKGGAGGELAAVKFSGVDGEEQWRHLFGGNGKDLDRAAAVAVDSNDDVFAAGAMLEAFNVESFVTVKLAKADGVIGPIDGHKLLVADDSSNPSKRKIVGIAKESSLVLPEPGSMNDPTVAGATVTLKNPDTAESASFVLPGGPEWKGLGNPAGSKGYKYKDKDGTNGPCGGLVAKPNKLVKVTCKGAAIPFTLDEPTQTSLSLGIQFGTASAQCAVFSDGLVAKDEGTSNPGPKGIFKAGKGPAADGNCP